MMKKAPLYSRSPTRSAAPQAEPALLDELAVEVDGVADHAVVAPLLLPHAVDEDGERRRDAARQPDPGGDHRPP